jgi:hypothetical protein
VGNPPAPGIHTLLRTSLSFLGLEDKIGIWYRKGHASHLADFQALLDLPTGISLATTSKLFNHNPFA